MQLACREDRRAWQYGGVPAGLRVEILAQGDPGRLSLEHHIREVYRQAHGAEVRHFARYLVGLRRVNGAWYAGAGYSPAGDLPLFAEQYLDGALEDAISCRLGAPVRRDQLVEVGNLAASNAGSARHLIVQMAACLQQLGRPWVVFTSTRLLLNSFTRLGVAPLRIAQADPLRLPDQGRSWGTYYENDPQVMAADLHLGLMQYAVRMALPRPPADLT